MKFIQWVWKSRLNLLRRLFFKLIRIYAMRFGYCQVSVETQRILFNSVGLDREVGLTRINEVTEQEFNASYSEDNSMFSEHLVLFAAIAKCELTISRVLEIGTFDGRSAVILSKLFPQANIITVDLPDTDSEFCNTYGRGNNYSEFVAKRNALLDTSSNIDFRQINSLELTNFTERFDLIWIDGSHGYPVVAMDVANSYRLSNEDGFILIDDVWTSVNSSDKYYKSIGGFESLSVLRGAGLIEDFTLFNKRLGGQYNLAWEKKYVGFFRKHKV